MCDFDWAIFAALVQAFGGIGALYFLYKTLKAQNKTLQEQQKLTKLEHRRYLESIIPILSIIEEGRFGLTINVGKNTLFDLSVIETSYGKLDFEYDCNIKNYPNGTNIVFNFDLDLMEKNNILMFGISLTFKDKFNNRYQQYILIKSKDDIFLDQIKPYDSSTGLSAADITY